MKYHNEVSLEEVVKRYVIFEVQCHVVVPGYDEIKDHGSDASEERSLDRADFIIIGEKEP